MKSTLENKILVLKQALLLAALGSLVACSSVKVRQPVELVQDPNLLQPQLQWQQQIGKLNYPLQLQPNPQATVALASQNGEVKLLQLADGALRWQTKIAAKTQTAAGNDGANVAVVTNANELVLLNEGVEVWRKLLPNATYSAPMVLAGRVFVSSAENSVLAYDIGSGSRIWQYGYKGSDLGLKTSLSMLAIGNELVVGEIGKLIGLNPIVGDKIWTITLNDSYYPTNELEQVQAVVGQVSRVGDQLCLAVYDTNISCVDIAASTLQWSSPQQSYYGIAGDENQIFVADKDGVISAFDRYSVEKNWRSEYLLYHTLFEPIALANAVVVGDSKGWLHFLGKDDGKLLKRLRIDSSPIKALWRVDDSSLLVISSKGLVQRIGL